LIKYFNLHLISEKDSFSLWFDDSLKEIETPIALKLIGGPLPSYLSGILIKNGPASFGEVEIEQDGSSPSPRRRYSHIFDGLAKLTKYEFTKEGSISFTSKFLHSSIYNRVVKEKG
jgi:carotenoid cleavage dioxygenase-like enzyme